MPKKFHRAAFDVEAEQYDGSEASIKRLIDFVGASRIDFTQRTKELLFATKYSHDDNPRWQSVEIGHWLCRHPNGDVYISHPNHFQEGGDYTPTLD